MSQNQRPVAASSWALDSLVVAEVDDLEPLHVAHLLGQRLQLVGVQEEHGGVLPAAHL